MCCLLSVSKAALIGAMLATGCATANQKEELPEKKVVLLCIDYEGGSFWNLLSDTASHRTYDGRLLSYGICKEV